MPIKRSYHKELQNKGVMVEALYEAVDKQVDLFDLIMYYDQPLTRKKEPNNVKNATILLNMAIKHEKYWKPY
jgi:hypothetical protein